MHHHELHFTDEDSNQLRLLYREFINQVEKGSAIEAFDFDVMMETMKVILYSQKELQDFWKNVQQNPQKQYRLHITHKNKEFLNMPWQMAIDNEKYPFVYFSKGTPGIKTFPQYKPKDGPLRILVMISSPEHLNFQKRLSYEEEEQVILKSLGPLWETGQVQIDFTEDGSLLSLQQQLELHSYHILYFSGHGSYKNNTGYLELENAETLKKESVTAKQLATVVMQKPKHAPAVVILSSCKTAQGHSEEGFRGVADELIYMGVPAVIAMAFSIADDYSVVFASKLYEQLAGKKELPEAYTNAMLAMKEDEQEHLRKRHLDHYRPTQWLIPQLYTNQQIGHIVNWKTSSKSLKKVTSAGFIKGDEFLLLSPRNNYHFIGRRREGALLFSQLLHHKPIVILGQGGIGKTALAEHMVKRLMIHHSTYHCFGFNENSFGANDMISRLQEYIGKAGIKYKPAKTGATIFDHLDFLLKQVTTLCKPIFVFDSMESFQQAPCGPLKKEYSEWMKYIRDKLLHKFPVLFTGRYPVPELESIHTIRLNQQPFTDYYRKCLQLSFRTIQQQDNLLDLSHVASLLYTMFGGNYRVVEVFEEIYNKNKARTLRLLQRIVTGEGKIPKEELKELVHDGLKRQSKKIDFAALIDLLNQQEATTLRRMAYFNLPVLPLALSMQEPGKKFEADLLRLKDMTLIEEYTRRLKNENEETLTFYFMTPLVKGWRANTSLPSFTLTYEYAGDYFTYVCDEVTHKYEDLEEAFSFYRRSGNIEKINKTGKKITNQYFKDGLYDLTIEYGDYVEALAGDKTDPDVFNNLGLTYLKYRKFELALPYLTKFLIASRKVGNKSDETKALNSIAQVYFEQDDFDNSMLWAEKSLQLAIALKEKEDEAIAYTTIGRIHGERGDYDKALKIYNLSLRIRQKSGSRKKEALVLNNIAGIYSNQGNHEESLKILQKSLSIAIEAGDIQLEGAILNNIGAIYLSIDEFETALTYFQKGLVVSRSINDEERIGEALSAMGTIHKMIGNYDESVEYVTKGSLQLEKFSYPDMDKNTSYQLSNIYVSQGKYEEAIPLLLESLSFFKKTDNPRMESLVSGDIGIAYFELGIFDKSIKFLKKGLSLANDLGDTKHESELLFQLVLAYVSTHEFDIALKYLLKRLVLYKSLGDRAGEAAALQYSGIVYLAKEDPEMFSSYMREAYSISSEINNLEGLFETGLHLGIYYCEKDNEESSRIMGLQLLQQSYEIGIQSNYNKVEGIPAMIAQYSGKKKKLTRKQTKLR